MSNGLIVERKGKNSDLKVIDPNGQKGGQQLLNEFVEQLALDLPKFMGYDNKEKAKSLLRIIGVGDKLFELEKQETELYNYRLGIGQVADQKKKYAKEMTYYPDAPKELVSPAELIKQQQDILVRNGENQRKRQNLQRINEKVNNLSNQIAELQRQLDIVLEDQKIAFKSATDLQDESTAELEKSLLDIETINVKVRANLDKDKAEEDAKQYENQYNQLTTKINQVRQAKTDLLNGANLPLPGLSVLDGELTYNGKKWDCMSGSEQMIVATSIVRKLNPKCGFVLLDKLEAMDLDTLAEFGRWLEREGLQAIATRVSTGGECSLIIEDGYVAGQVIEETPKENAWKAGEF
jgi:hypothetical protein